MCAVHDPSVAQEGDTSPEDWGGDDFLISSPVFWGGIAVTPRRRGQTSKGFQNAFKNRDNRENRRYFGSSYFSVTSPRPAILPVAVLPGGTNWQATMLPLDTNMPFLRVLP
jgi:hypothetical protein